VHFVYQWLGYGWGSLRNLRRLWSASPAGWFCETSCPHLPSWRELRAKTAPIRLIMFWQPLKIGVVSVWARHVRTLACGGGEQHLRAIVGRRRRQWLVLRRSLHPCRWIANKKLMSRPLNNNESVRVIRWVCVSWWETHWRPVHMLLACTYRFSEKEVAAALSRLAARRGRCSDHYKYTRRRAKITNCVSNSAREAAAPMSDEKTSNTSWSINILT
jgi:hypothetical protein